ncbi:serine hydrolase, partial [Streptomyces sp. NPDC006463]|uniref:serine hydrolase n=1 Tax=Streptomyces sp. NPDC006463 TaxID=3364746 RepID=UPI0036AE360E
AKAEADPEAKAEADPEAKAEADPEAKAEADPEAKAEADPEAEPEPQPKADAEPEAGPETDAEPEAEPKAETETEVVSEAKPEAKAEPEEDTEPEVEAEAEPEADPEPQPKADAEPEAKPEPQPEADLESVEVAPAGPDEAEDTAPAADSAVPEDAVVPDEADVPDDADDTADEAPKTAGAPDEVDDEAETDAPEVETETETEAGPEEKDDAEAAGPPARVPSWARGAEGDSEKTSQFVALKPLDTPAPTPSPTKSEPYPWPEAKAPTVAAPLAPLDLLAELTNTAPPPETPRRTVVRRVKVWTPILLLLAGAFTGAQLLRPLPAPAIVAAEPDRALDGQFSIPWPAKGQGAVRVPGSGDIGTFGEQKPVPTASVAKVMTAYVILKNHPLRKTDPGPSIEVDAKAVGDGTSEHESRIEGLTAGSKFSQQDMLKMLMIPSANNVARLLARWDSGSDSETAFVEKMNAAARELGMRSTTYTDPSGLDAGTVSTAADQLKLAEAVMKDEAFRAIVALPNATIKGLSKPLLNNNTLLTAQGLSIRGIKTGSSTPAGGTLMWAAYKSVGDETPLILGTLMDQHVDGPDPDGSNSLVLVQANSKKIIEAVREALASAPVVRKGQQVGYVDDGLGGRTPLVATKDLNVIGVPGQRLKLTLESGATPVPHTAKAGAEIGVLTAGEGDGAKSVPVAVQGALAEPSFGTRLTRLG